LPRVPLSPSIPTANDKGKGVLVISWVQRRSYEASFLLLVGFAKKNRIGREIGP
jgi:hypothetical protein